MKLVNQNQDIIKIKIYSKMSDDGLLVWSDNFPLPTEIVKDENTKTNCASLRSPTHGDFVQIKEFLMQFIDEKDLEISHNIYLTYFFLQLLTDWDFLDKDGNVLEYEPDGFLKLDAKVKPVLLCEFELQIEEFE